MIEPSTELCYGSGGKRDPIWPNPILNHYGGHVMYSKGHKPPQSPRHTEYHSAFLLVSTVNHPMLSQGNPFLRLFMICEYCVGQQLY